MITKSGIVCDAPQGAVMQAKKGHILVVDDEADLRDVVIMSFERRGHVTYQAGNSVEALSVMENNKIDVVISDIRMPGGDGLRLLAEVKRRNPDIPVVFIITGFTDFTDEDLLSRGCKAIFNKPFDINALVTAVEKVIVKS